MQARRARYQYSEVIAEESRPSRTLASPLSSILSVSAISAPFRALSVPGVPHVEGVQTADVNVRAAAGTSCTTFLQGARGHPAPRQILRVSGETGDAVRRSAADGGCLAPACLPRPARAGRGAC